MDKTQSKIKAVTKALAVEPCLVENGVSLFCKQTAVVESLLSLLSPKLC
jgi:hypothetical protein